MNDIKLFSQYSSKLTACLATAVACFLPLSGCVGKLFYYPDAVDYGTPASSGLTFEDVWFNSKDGTKLHGWFVFAMGKAKGTVIHFHGNAQNLSAHFDFVSWLPSAGYNVFVFDYRGFGKSKGTPERKGVYEDCLAAIEYVESRTDIDQNKLFLIGQSLGAANAILVMGKNKYPGIKAVVAEAPFSSYRKMVRDRAGYIPILGLLKWPLSFILIDDGWSTEKVVANVSPVPLLIIHGTKDEVVQYYHSRILFKKAKEPKYLWTIKDGEHTEAFIRFGKEYRKKLLGFFDECVKE